MICDRARGDREPWLRGLSMHPRHAKAEQKCGAKLCERRHLAVLSSGLLLATKAASAAGDNHLCGEGPSAQTAIALSSLPACSGTISQTPTAVATMKTGIVREARAKEPVACCSRDGGERPQHKSDEEADEPHDAIGDTPNAVARGWHRNRRFADLYGSFSVKWFFGCYRFLVWSGKAVPRPVACDQVRGARGKVSRDRNASAA